MWEKIFIDGQLLGILIGSGLSYFIARLTILNSKQIQKDIWKKEFDKYQTEPIIEVFKNIMVITGSNSAAVINHSIPQEYLNELKIRTHLVRYFSNELKDKINNNVYLQCLEYNELSIIKDSETKSSTENEVRVEKEKRELIEKNILEILDDIKSNYSEL